MRYDGIQVLRGIAALLVLIVHAILVMPAPRDMFFHPLAYGGGAIGVDIFFVISGFVVSLAAEKPGIHARNFLCERSLRVLPIYFVVSLPFLLLDRITWSKIWNTLFFVPMLDFGQYTDPLHWLGWTIGLEMWFYAMLALSMLVMPKSPFRLFAGLIVCLVAGGLLYESRWVAIRYITTPVAVEFLFGTLIYCFRGRLSLNVSLALLVIGLWAMWHGLTYNPWMVEMALVSKTVLFANPIVGVTRLIVWGIPAAMVVAAIVGMTRAETFKWPGPLRWFGDISYSFYLAQPLAIILTRQLFLSDWRIAWAILFALNLGMAWLMHQYVDVPLRRRLRWRGCVTPPAPAVTTL